MTQQSGTTVGATEREYQAALEGAACFTLARGTLEVGGPKRQDYLHAMLSNDVKGLAAGQGCRAASMTAKGSLQAFVRVLVGPNVVVLETEQQRLEPVLRTLEHHKVGAPVRFATRPVAVLGVIGPRAAEVLAAAGAAPLPEEQEAHAEVRVGEATVRLIRAGDVPGGGFVLHAAPEAAAALGEALARAGAVAIGRETLDARRVETLCPWYGTDVGEDNLLHETGLLGVMHSSSKGCYVGQEVIARLEGRGGNVNKALRGLRLDAAVAPGTTLTASGREAGWLTTCAVSPRLGPIALGYVHRSQLASGSELAAGGVAARVVEAFPEAGAAA